MKKLIFSFSLVAFTITAPAQNNEGMVRFEEKRQIQLTLDSAQVRSMKIALPKESVSQSTLLFTPEASYYQYNEDVKDEKPLDEENNGRSVVVKIDKPDNKFYRDLKNNKFIQYHEFLTRKFLITADIGKPDWKLTGNQKTILGYSCMEAKRQDGADTIIAWFAPSIPVSTGPSAYGNLPGLILSADVNNGQLVISAIDVRIVPVDRKLLIKPTEGKRVTEEEYKKIVEEKKKEMQEQNGGNENVIIRIQDDHH